MSRIDQYFNNRTAAISGAGDGIGRALARRLNEAGCRLWLSDIDAEKLHATSTLLDPTRASVSMEVVDCGNRDAIFQWAESVSSETTNLHALFNNAGVGYGALFSDSSEKNFKWLIDINLWGVIHSTRAFLPLLLRADRAHLVNLSSIFGMVGVPTQSAYNAAKFGVRGFSEALQAEYRGTNLFISCVHPGGVLTNIARAARTDGQESLADADARDTRFRRLARTTPEKAAETILDRTVKGKPRILVGLDAWFLQQLTKVMPTSYHLITARLREII